MAAPVIQPDDLDSLDEERADLYRRQVTRAACESSLLWFVRYFFRVREGIEFRVNWHHRQIVQALERVWRGEVLNLVINIPPGSSKTEIAVINFMAWSLALNPRCRFLHLSYADTLVEENSSKCKALVESEEFQELWPIETAKDSKAKKRWNVMLDGKRAGGVYAVALGGTITGFRAGHMAEGFQGAIIIDDPLKPEDAFSDTKLAAANRKLSDTVRSRRANPATPIIIIMQRLHVEDPTNYALTKQIGGLKFEHVKIPALGDDGESYWPYKEPTHELIAWKEANPYTFAGQMMQEPTVLGGTIFKTSWFRYWSRNPSRPGVAKLPKVTLVRIYVDTAMKTKEANDFSVFEVWGLGTDGNIYLLDLMRGKWEAPQLEAQARSFWAKWRGRPMGDDVTAPSAMSIEDKTSGTGLVQTLQQSSPIPVIPIPRETDKLVRANSGAPSIAAGRVFLPDPVDEPVPWLADYLSEFAAFNAEGTHKHDDQIDPTLDAIHDLLLGSANFYKGWL